MNKPTNVSRRARAGTYVTVSTIGDERVRAFVPAPLPPTPPIEIDGALRLALDEALVALGRLDGVSGFLPDRNLFLYSFVRKEAVLSSQIEGTQSSLSDLLLAEIDEAPGVPVDDVSEVSNCVAAIEYGVRRLREDFPLSNRLLREMHEIMLRGGGCAGAHESVQTAPRLDCEAQGADRDVHPSDHPRARSPGGDRHRTGDNRTPTKSHLRLRSVPATTQRGD